MRRTSAASAERRPGSSPGVQPADPPVFVQLVQSSMCSVFICVTTGGGGPREAAGPGPRAGRSRQEQHAAGFERRRVGG